MPGFTYTNLLLSLRGTLQSLITQRLNLTLTKPTPCFNPILTLTLSLNQVLTLKVNDLCSQDMYFVKRGKMHVPKRTCASEDIGILQLNCLSVGRKMSETSSPRTCPMVKFLHPTVCVAFWNRQSEIHIHFTLWLASCVWLRKELGFKLFTQPLVFHFWHNYFWHFLGVQMHATIWMSSRKDHLKVCAIFPTFLW